MIAHHLKIDTLVPLLATLCLAACGSSDPDPATTDPADPASTEFFELAHERASEVDPAVIDYDRVTALQQANTAAAFRLFRKLRVGEKNLIYSPLSFSRVFAGYYDGERLADAFEAVFGFTPDVATIEAWNELFHLATDRSQFADVSEDERSRFESTDVYWVDNSSGGNASGNADWGAFDRVHTMPLAAEPEKARELINGWVEERSHGMLADFLEPGLINESTAAVATNVVYFVGAWKQEYAAVSVDFEGAGEIAGFTGVQETSAAITEDGITILRLPYAHDYNHYILMPDEDFEVFASELDEARYSELKGALRAYEVTFTIPEFESKSDPKVNDAVGAIRAETGTEGETLSGAYKETYVHKAAIEFTREGTRAAAASAVIEGGNSEPEPPQRLTVTIDKLFVHVIEDGVTGSILFLGEFAGP